MRTILLLLLLTGFAAQAQISDEEVLAQLDRLQLGFTDPDMKLSSFYSGEPITTQEGPFLVKKRQEYLCIVPVNQGERSDRIAFVVYRPQPKAGWEVSNWVAMRFASIEAKDIQADGLKELLLHVKVPGRRMTNEVWRVLSIAGDRPAVLFESEGFSLSAESLTTATVGMHIRRQAELELTDMNDDGKLELVETVIDYLFGFDDANGNNQYEPVQRVINTGDKRVVRFYAWEKDTFILTEER